MSFIVYAIFKDLDYKLGSFKTYRTARESVRSVSEEGIFNNEFTIVERTSTYKKIFDSREDL